MNASKLNFFIIALLFIFSIGKAQERFVLPGQELLYPNLTDPSFTGEEGRTQIIAMGQFVDLSSERASQYINAQLPIYDNVSFGIDFFKNKFDFYNFSQVFLSAAYEIPIGEYDHIKFGLAGGGESLSYGEIPPGQLLDELPTDINTKNIDFTYRAGLHFTGRNITVGGSYFNLPAQQITKEEGVEDLLGYQLLDGYTAYFRYRIRAGQHFALSPMIRYLSFSDDAIFEGGIKLQFQNKFDFSVAYRHDYSINPAFRLHFFKSLLVGYSYETAMGKMAFSDIHSFSLSYKFNKAKADEEPEWLENARGNIAKTKTIKKSKPKDNKKSKEKTATEEVEKINETVAEEILEIEGVLDVVEEEGVLEREEVEEVEEVLAAEEILDNVESSPITSADNVEVEDKTKVSPQNENVEETSVKNPFEKAVLLEMSSRVYLVAKSFDRYQAAYNYKVELRNNGIKTLIGTIKNDRKFYVYVDSFNNEEEANSQLEDYKTQEALKNIYILKVD